MKSTWVKGLDVEKTKRITEDYNASGGLRERLVEISKAKIDTSRSSITSKDMYASPSWAYVQADAIGYERAINEIISLISN